MAAGQDDEAQRLDELAERLYALPPEDFTAARDAAAKQEQDRSLRAAVKALRRPSVSAWVVDVLAREQPDLLGQLLELGPALARAQGAGRGDELRALGQQRRELVEAVVSTAVGLVDRPVTAQVRAEVAATLEAALADPASADAVRSGRLVRALSYAGFGGVDLEGAVAVAPAARPPRRRTAPPPPDPVPAAEAAALDAAAALDDAVRAAEAAGRRAAEASTAADEARAAAASAEDHVARLETELVAARRERDTTARAARRAGHDQQEADASLASARQAVRDAQDEAERARAALDALRRA